MLSLLETPGYPSGDAIPFLKPRLVGRYVLCGLIGSGGCATVHLGRLISEAGFSRTVAVKRLLSEYSADPEFVAMFLDEARLVARIHHPNVVQTLDVFWSDSERGRELFMIMEYVAGETLARLIAKGASPARPSLRVVLAIACDVLRGLDAAHNAKNVSGELLQLVHRDVSPENVIVSVHGVARVLDFGIAKAVGGLHTTRHGDFKGKAAYMAPEQILGSATKLSDVYSASVVLWEALTGRRLFQGENQAAILHKVVTSQIEPPGAMISGVPESVDAIVMRGLARDPGERFPSAKAMVEAIEGSGEIAPPSEVSHWLHVVANDELGARAAQVAFVERLQTSSLVRLCGDSPAEGQAADRPSPAVTPSERSDAGGPSPSKLRERAGTAVAVGLVAIVLALATFIAGRARSGPAAHETAQAPVEITSPAAPPLESARTDGLARGRSSVPVDATKSTVAAPDGGTLPNAPVRVPRPRRPALSASPACSPPFLVDSAGRMHFKTECL